MPAFQTAHFVPFLLALVAPSSRDEIAFGVAAETTLVRTLQSGYSVELESVALTMGGEEVPDEFLGEMDIRVEREDSYVVTDVFESVDDGRPQRLRRSFDELSGHEQARFSNADSEESHDSDYESALEGQSVVFTWNEESGEYDVAFDEGAEGETELLEELDEDMDLRRLLPEHAVAEGDSWEIEAGVFACISDPGGELALLDSTGENEDRSSINGQLRDNLSGTIKASYVGTRDVDGTPAAVIELDIETLTHGEEELPGEELPPGGSGTSRIESSYQLEGELLWDMEHGHALSLELAGTTGFTMAQAVSGEHEGESIEQEQKMVFAGSATFSMRFERK